MKKKSIWMKIVAGVVALAVVGTGALYATGMIGTSKKNNDSLYQVVSLKTGDLQKTVVGTGSLSAGTTVSETAPVDLTIDSIQVTAGQSVAAGDMLATVDVSKLRTTISTLRSEISSLDSSIAKLADEQSTTSTVKSAVDGRVKLINVAKGADVNTSTMQSGLMLLSTDSKMRVDIPLQTANSVAVGSAVTVTSGASSYTGNVLSVSADGTSCVVTLTDNGPAVGAVAEVFAADGTKLGSGTLSVNAPVVVTAESGIVNKIYVKVNQKVYTNTNLVYLTKVPYSEEYANAIEQREQKVAALQQALAIESTGALAAAQDGIVDSVEAKEGQAVTSGSAVLSLLTGGVSLDVSIDELDIGSVQVGQSASVAFDAIENKTYTATVKTISQVGSASNGVTTYTVSLALDSANGQSVEDALKIGMNATATIVTEERKNVLLLPLNALQTSRGESYVWLYNGTLPTNSGTEPGTKTVVQTGMSNANYVQITDGLSEADQVVVVRSTSSSSNTNNKQNGMMFGGMGGELPSGRLNGSQNRFPSGGGQNNKS